MKANKLKTAMRVFCIDDAYGKVYGTVTLKTADKIFIKWEDISEPVEFPIKIKGIKKVKKNNLK